MPLEGVERGGLRVPALRQRHKGDREVHDRQDDAQNVLARPFGGLFDAFSPVFSGVLGAFPCFSGGFKVVLEVFLRVPRGEEGPVPLGAPEEFAGPEDPELYDDLADEEEGEEHPESSTP